LKTSTMPLSTTACIWEWTAPRQSTGGGEGDRDTFGGASDMAELLQE
jgi:hypothetical protein